MKKYDFNPEKFQLNDSYKELFPTFSNPKFIVIDNILGENIRSATGYTNNEDGTKKIEIGLCYINHIYRQEDTHDEKGKVNGQVDVLDHSQIIFACENDQICEGYIFVR